MIEGKVVSAPVIQSTIAGGRGVITGRFTREEAQAVADRLNAYRQKALDFLENARQDVLKPGQTRPTTNKAAKRE